MPTSSTHNAAVLDLRNKLEPIAKKLGLELMSDEAIWYLDPDTDEQKSLYPDLAFVKSRDSVTAEDALLVIEIVSTHERRKERKDTIRQRVTNEANKVPEFGLYFPDVDDQRVLDLFQFDRTTGLAMPARAVNGRFISTSVRGLEFQVLPKSEWKDGVKIDVYFEGKRCLSADEERQRANQEAQRANQEAQRANQEAQRADQEAQRADQEGSRAARLAARLRALGIDPEDE